VIVLASGVLGAVFGVTNARRRKGNGLDMAQYGAGYAIAFMIVGVFLTLIVERLVS